ncbi:MAG: hypothetical protein K0R93_690 [Anaerosolibacter sp.]|jgi:hypothetical protein|uniref:DUF2569 family protein n=1 Tax=Anaerosolibacter sp. TaxID=1872527 RepID=UPI00261B8081|nr:DUF2569 family protein [Anaerosolibacter sp.]MDF2545792.1 hypothetical protein [Anaerosolibacter sp.]
MNDTSTINKNKKKVGGWLLLFIATLIIIYPISSFMKISWILNRINLLGEQYPKFTTYGILAIVLTTLIAILGIYAGILLFRLKSNSLKIVKIFLILKILITCLDNFLLINSGVLADVIYGVAIAYKLSPEASKEVLTKVGTKNVLQSLAYSGVWYAYLINSKRVKDTYNF